MNTRLYGLLIILLSALASCSKDEQNTPPQQTTDPQLRVKLHAPYMPASQVDSAIAVFEIAGQRIQKLLQVSGDTLKTSLAQLPPGNGLATIQVYSKKVLNQRKLQWEKRLNFSFTPSASIHLPGPVALNDNNWFNRVIMTDAATGFTAIVALHPNDPYFMLKNIPLLWDEIELERGYYTIPGGAQSVGKGLWLITNNTQSTIENRTFFQFLPSQIGSQPWAMVEIGVGLYNNSPNPGPSFYFNHY